MQPHMICYPYLPGGCKSLFIQFDFYGGTDYNVFINIADMLTRKIYDPSKKRGIGYAGRTKTG